MANQPGHPMMAQMTHDEAARDGFVLGLKQHLSGVIGPGNRPLYENRVLPKLRKRLGREPRDRHEVRGDMEREPYHQAWGSLMRTAQEMMWDSVGASVDRQIGGLIAKSKAPRKRLGTLRLDRHFRAPRYLTAVDHHSMPGSYLTDRTEDNLWAGAVYDRGAYVYQLGRVGGTLMDARGQALASYLCERRPGLAPRRVSTWVHDRQLDTRVGRRIPASGSLRRRTRGADLALRPRKGRAPRPEGSLLAAKCRAHRLR